MEKTNTTTNKVATIKYHAIQLLLGFLTGYIGLNLFIIAYSFLRIKFNF